MDLNKVTLIGTVRHGSMLHRGAADQTVTQFSLATSYSWQDAATKIDFEAVDFHDIVAHGRLGEIVKSNVREYARIFVEGRLRNRVARGRGGAIRVTPFIVAESIILLGSRSSRVSKVGNDERPRPVESEVTDVGGTGR